MNVALATHLQYCQRLKLGSHERENRLLFVAQIHHHWLLFLRQQVNDGELHTVQILHLIYLNPRIALATFVFFVYVVGQQKQVLKVEHVVFGLTLLVTRRIIHLPKQMAHLVGQLPIEPRCVSVVKI